MTPTDAAKQINEKYWNYTIPVDPAAIAHAMGIKVYAHDSMDVSGFYDAAADGPQIHFSRSEAPVRQRFTIAHELGHHVLKHGPKFRDPSKNFSLANFDPEEAEANRFAAEILMPADAVRYYFEHEGVSTLEGLCEIFKVSGVAMKLRLTNLGYL